MPFVSDRSRTVLVNEYVPAADYKAFALNANGVNVFIAGQPNEEAAKNAVLEQCQKRDHPCGEQRKHAPEETHESRSPPTGHARTNENATRRQDRNCGAEQHKARALGLNDEHVMVVVLALPRRTDPGRDNEGRQRGAPARQRDEIGDSKRKAAHPQRVGARRGRHKSSDR